MIADWNTVILSKIKSILSKMDKQNDTTESISTDISFVKDSVSNISSSISALNTNINDYIGDTKSVIKSIQRGYCNNLPINQYRTNVDISEVDVSKSIIILNGFAYSGSITQQILITEFKPISFTVTASITSNSNFYVRFDWQVIEFY